MVSKQVFAVRSLVDPQVTTQLHTADARVKPNYWRYGHSHTYEFAIPQVIEVKVQAEADDIRINSILKLEANGCSTDSTTTRRNCRTTCRCVRVTINHRRLRTISQMLTRAKWRTHLDAVLALAGTRGEANGTRPKDQPIHPGRRRSTTSEQLIYDATTAKQVDRAIAKSRQTVENSTEEDDEQNELAEALLLIIVALMIARCAYLSDGNSC